MPSYSKVLLGLVLLQAAVALPTPQLAGEGKAFDSLFTDTDNGVGYGIKNAEDNTAALITSVKGGSSGPAPPSGPSTRRQLAGEGKAFDSLFTDTDNGVGYGTKNAEDNTAALISSLTGGAGTGPAPPAGSRKNRRQLDKISNGFQSVSNAAGTGYMTISTTTALDNIDGDLTDGAAKTGADVGSTEDALLEHTGSAVPKTRRQLDKISNGFQDVSNAAGTGSSTSTLTTALDNVDGELTDGAANAGDQVGTTEANTLESIGKAVPKL